LAGDAQCLNKCDMHAPQWCDPYLNMTNHLNVTGNASVIKPVQSSQVKLSLLTDHRHLCHSKYHHHPTILCTVFLYSILIPSFQTSPPSPACCPSSCILYPTSLVTFPWSVVRCSSCNALFCALLHSWSFAHSLFRFSIKQSNYSGQTQYLWYFSRYLLASVIPISLNLKRIPVCSAKASASSSNLLLLLTLCHRRIGVYM